MTLATILALDMPQETVRGEQTASGMRAKRRPGDKKRRRLELLPEVLRLREAGLSYRAIAERTGVPYRTVQDWIRGA